LLPGDEFTIGPLTFRLIYEYDGNLESVPTPRYADAVEETIGEGSGDWASHGVRELPVPQVNDDLPAKPANRSESSEIVIPNFMDLADADPEAVIPGLPAGNSKTSAAVPTGSSWPPATDGNPLTVPITDCLDEPLEVDSSLQSGSHRKESPWTDGSSLIDKLRQMPLTSTGKATPAEPEMPPVVPSPDKAAKPPTKAKPPAIRPKKPSYGEEIDPEFGNFLEGLE